jgi:pyruvate dehydrogenase E2 component (dihydrolipoamide acetyltransferase)
MSIEFKLPDLGENISSAGVLAVLVKPGDTIFPDTPVLEIETDKATVEVPSSVGGTVSSVLVKAGDKAQVGQVIITLEVTPGADKPKPVTLKVDEAPQPQPEIPKAPPTPPGKPISQEVLLPDLGENITSANVLSVLVKVGDPVTAETAMVEIETDKATLEVPVGMAGTVEKIHVAAGEKAQVGQPVLRLLAVAVSKAPAPAPPAAQERKSQAPVVPAVAPKATPPQPNGSHKVTSPKPLKPAPASPTVRRLAREIGVDVNVVKGSGPKGRIQHDDIKAHARALLRAQPSPGVGPAAGPWRPTLVPLPDFSKFGTIEREAMTGIRRKTAETMAQAWSTIPMVTQFDKADVSEVEKLRQKLDPKARQQGGKLTVTAILAKICASALKRFPKFNASLDMGREEVVFKKYFNIGVAVDTERGLLVPVLKNVPSKNIFEISAELQAIAEKARARKITPDDLQGGCFTITNLGGIGGTSFTPIVNPPEVAILGVSRSAVEPVWLDGQFVPKTMLPLSLSYDHRLIDGAEAARFLRFVCEALENPALLLFEG